MIFDGIRQETGQERGRSPFRATMPVLAAMILVATTVSAQEHAPGDAAAGIVRIQESAPQSQTQSTEPNRGPSVDSNAAPRTSAFPELRFIGFDPEKQRPMTLHEAVELALSDNQDIEIARKTVRMAELDATSAKGAYDPRFYSSVFAERGKTPATSIFTLGRDGDSVMQASVGGSVGLNGLASRFGGRYEFEFSSSRATTDNAFSFFDRLNPSSFSATFTQPLMRGRGIDDTRARLEIAKRNTDLTDREFRRRAIETVARVESAYWDAAFAFRDVRVRREMLDDARAQLESVRRKVREGTAAPMDAAAVEAQVARFEQNVFLAVDGLSRAQNALKFLIARDPEASIWKEAILPVDSIDQRPPVVTEQAALETAFSNRPELRRIAVARDINKIEQDNFRDKIRPQVDLTITYTVSGLAGAASNAPNPFNSAFEPLVGRLNTLSRLAGLPDVSIPAVQAAPSVLVGGYGQSLENLFAGRFSTVRVGVTVSVPLRNRTAEADFARSRVEGERIDIEREQTRQRIQVEVRNALQGVRTAEAVLRAATVARESAEREYLGERHRFTKGASSSSLFVVLQRQTAFNDARNAEVRAQTELNKAVAELSRAMGSTLIVNNVVALR